jgi:septum formation topological specificity factor MinE
LVKILEGRTENAIKNRFQLVFAKLRKRKENKSKPELDLITDYVKENGGVIPVKKQRDPAVNNETPPPLSPKV